MRRHISGRMLWRHIRRGLLLYGATVGGSMYCYLESEREESAVPQWDWSIPHRWYDMAHRD
ncbi:hypothetical protein [Nocardia sp. NPDC050710]|uniref:hypothetical protein n=1 Tax=Nocardia sp. NPDC050710 TaxID=3157220 RepID=UPI0033FA9229